MKKTTNQELSRISAHEYSTTAKRPIVIILDNVRSANNVGSFFRTCDAFGISELILCGITATPPSRDIHKTALSAELVVPWQYFQTTAQAIEHYKDQDYKIVAIEQVHDSTSLEDFTTESGQNYALVFGNEVDGVSPEALAQCDLAVEIPQHGTKHSLNVSVACGVVLWQMR